MRKPSGPRKIALPKRGLPPDAPAGMSTEAHMETSAEWPGPGVLLFCVCLLVAGFGAALWRGPAPAGEVRVRVMPPPAAEEPAQP